jgi:hypothetical protein
VLHCETWLRLTPAARSARPFFRSAAGVRRSARGAAVRTAILLLAAMPLDGAASQARALDETAEQILAAARAVHAGAHDKSVHVTMRIVSPSGDERVRVLRGFEKRTGEGKKLLWLFDSPAELAGTAFLAWQQRPLPDEMWVYFPGQRRVRRISPDLRREQFQGSTFTYEDLTTVFDLDYDGTHTLRGEEPCAGQRCWVVETVLPADAYVYQHLRTWIRTDDHLPSRIELDGAGVHKVMTVRRVADVEGIPTILEVAMENPADGYHTTVEFSAVDYNASLGDDLFTVGHLSQLGK